MCEAAKQSDEKGSWIHGLKGDARKRQRLHAQRPAEENPRPATAQADGGKAVVITGCGARGRSFGVFIEFPLFDLLGNEESWPLK